MQKLWNKMTGSERLITHGVLLAGAIIVAFPFLWMIGTSVKVRREMAADEQKQSPVPPARVVFAGSVGLVLVEPPANPKDDDLLL